VWADTLLQAERQHLLRLLFWAGLSIIAATAVAATVVIRRVRSSLLVQFAIQMLVWGGLVGAIAGVLLTRAQLRDVSGAARLERIVWMNIGLDAGYVAAGGVLAICAWRFGRRMGPIGAGIGVVVQGLALLLLDLQFAAIVSR
jgi:hypothetical protein